MAPIRPTPPAPTAEPTDGHYFQQGLQALTDEIERLAVQLLDGEARERFHRTVFVLRHSSALANAEGVFARNVATTVEYLARNAVTHVLSGEELRMPECWTTGERSSRGTTRTLTARLGRIERRNVEQALKIRKLDGAWLTGCAD